MKQISRARAVREQGFYLFKVLKTLDLPFALFFYNCKYCQKVAVFIYSITFRYLCQKMVPI